MTAMPEAPEAPRSAAAVSLDASAKLSDVARDLAVEAVLVSSAATLAWLGLPPTDGVHALVGGGDALVVAPEDVDADGELRTVRYDAALPSARTEAVRTAVAVAGIAGAAGLGIDAAATPAALLEALNGRAWRDASDAIEGARMRKRPDEVDRIRAAGELVAVAHEALRAQLEPGVTELALWSAARTAMEDVAGGPAEALVDLMSGERTALVGQPPTLRRAASGEPVLFDVAPCREAYWADSCATVACGKGDRELVVRHAAVAAALESGIAAGRPGARASDVDRAIRARLERAGLSCPHATGHGVGAAPRERPFLTPADDTNLEEGMVLAVEPGSYAGGVGVRLEHLVLIDADGARPLTSHSLELT